MDLRGLVRGTVDWSDLEGVGRELADRADEESVRIEFLEADNWLSTPLIVDEQWFVKIITPQNAFVHAVLTGARNIGAFSSGTAGFFERFDGPVEMGRHELDANERMGEIGLNTPEPVGVFEYEQFGVVVLEYLDDFRTLGDLSPMEKLSYTDELFEALARMHDHGLAHGDLRAENVLVVDGELYFIDATSVREDGMDGARAYDLACALAVLAPAIDAEAAVEHALSHNSVEDLLAAREFLDFVKLRPDHDFDAMQVKGEIEKAADAPRTTTGQ
ncbi:RIO1 family regulatory kinase/ATPase domain-containing protein [Natranaeroarchaeum sulfidigenes]|uniref:non-specific serine/threonine protein kinase n=1 Tax=Natranaeroarchaeum sulfidigenes TaxID=2784880 RepID=A0A897MM46_9EURY|nr:RIO1 family regulatory kinase/ATPase [Natranaeroarchaeum sulfidigenes]QSG03270.1 Serine/threonine protein kinase involved in cellcycle control [Natranaeroarchaeum sulfidigenes]